MMKTFLSLFLLLLWLPQLPAQGWTEKNKLAAPDRATNDRLGQSVSLSGTVAIVGAPWQSYDAEGLSPVSSAGAAYLFALDSSGNWGLSQKLVAADRSPNDFMGFSVAISGRYAISGAWKDDQDAQGGNAKQEAGSAYLYEQDSSGAWVQANKIVAFDRSANDGFAYAVAIDSNVALIGTFGEDHDVNGGNTLVDAGSAYVFTRDSLSGWYQSQKLVASDRGKTDYFGRSVSVNGDYALIGAYQEDHDAMGGDSLKDAGAAYLFKRDSIGVWRQEQKLVAADRESGDFFGFSVAIHEDYAVVGAYHEDENAAGQDSLLDPGAAYIFERDSSGQWNQVQKIVNSDREYLDLFGWSVSLHGDRLMVGAFGEDEDVAGENPFQNPGSVYLFERAENGQWNETQKIVASDRAADDIFGHSVSLSGEYAFVGALWQDLDGNGQNALTDAGAAYMFEFGLSTPVETSSYATLIRCYPNPSSGLLTVELGVWMAEVQLSVRSVTGQHLLSQRFVQTDQLEIVLNYPPGIYLLELRGPAGQTYRQKIIRQ